MRFFGFLILLLTYLNAQSSQSDEADTLSVIYLNNSVIISAQRYETNEFERSESIAHLKKAQLNVLSPMSMPEALSNVPGIWMQKTNHGGGSAFVRGLTGYQTLLMIDGIRMNNSTYRSGPNQYLNTVDPLMIANIEVLRGSGSVQYGSDAIGGTIHMFSKDPVFSSDGLHINGELYGKYWSDDMQKSGRGQVTIASEKLAFLGGFTYKNLGDIHAGGDLGFLEPTAYDEYSMDFKAKYKVKDNQTLIAAYQFLKQMDVPLYHKIAPGDYSTYHFDPQQRELAYLKWSSFYKNKWISEVHYTLSYQNSLEVREKQKSESPEWITEKDKINTIGANVEVISNLSKAWIATSGVEVYHDFVASNAEINDQESGELTHTRGLYPDGSTSDNFALYSLHNYSMNKWNFALGFRYNFVQLQLRDSLFGNTKISPDALVGNVGIVYKLNDHNHLTANINSAFRAPNINDVSSFGIADFRFEVPSYDLNPETSLNKELGYKIRYDRFSGAIHLFHNKLNDLIENVPSEYNGSDSLGGYKIYQRQNISAAAIYGGEVELEGKLGKSLISYGNISYTYGQNLSDNEPMRRIPPLNGRLGLRANFTKSFFAQAEWVFAAMQDRLSGGDIADDRIAEGGTPGWNLFNIYAGYDHRCFSINTSLQNVANAAYRIHGSGVDGVGRSFWVSLIIKINP